MPLAPLRHRVPCIAVLCAGLAVDPVSADAADSGFPPLGDLNAGVNRQAAHVPDPDRTDLWATPAELAARGAGDCEDFAIAKYFALVGAGVPAARLRIVYGALQFGAGEVWRPHVALVVLPEDGAPIGTAAVLDSVLDEVRPLSRRPDLRIRLSFNEEGLWAGLDRGPAAREARSLRPWARVLQQSGRGPSGVGLGQSQVQVERLALVQPHRVAAVRVPEVGGDVVGAGRQRDVDQRAGVVDGQHRLAIEGVDQQAQRFAAVRTVAGRVQGEQPLQR
ncbi:transglutaminase-like cysteine peptidase [Piscinibacter gummiphilus]|uniref:Uncharacterized protein n=1 Tax=Piscinibacter gummiphilus TaxID=946333 RepID=A0A1W6L6A4_9BURK|nr:transglutaminase-like cysteine peptidase [Piscinibacter gummiphilus]ARN19859.1 hypothetical protein A4W93_07995 [Piscinibacter gummiphilus]ATU64531.1 hypothetical protein CPZ87_08075 [Piscinibacter gummiphilus]GLS95059.1 hypothetical protein GCM10007918_23510 [Piscinibacter gummiphilus]